MIILYALIGPFLIWPLEYFFPFPYLIEELFKVVVFLISKKDSLKTYLIAGIAFAFSETVLYLININFLGKISLFLTRFLATSVLHSLTFAVIAGLGFKNKKLLFLGFLIAASIHYLYNLFIKKLLF